MKILRLIPAHYELLHKHHPEFTRKWISGLRSGRWTQTNGSMTNQVIPNSACCLMVMEAECNNHSTDYYLNGNFMPATLPTSKPDALQLVSPNGRHVYPQHLQADLKQNGEFVGYVEPASWNDDLVMTFEEIATLLETGVVTIH